MQVIRDDSWSVEARNPATFIKSVRIWLTTAALPPFPIINTLVLCSFDVLRMFVGVFNPYFFIHQIAIRIGELNSGNKVL